jgi:hypothetical protein
MESQNIYIVFNTFYCYIWIGNAVDNFYLQQLLNVTSLDEINNIEVSEEELFFGPDQEAKGWVQELYNIIHSLRVSILIYPEIKVLFEFDQGSEIILKELMLEDATKGYDFQTIKKNLTSQGSPLAMPY